MLVERSVVTQRGIATVCRQMTAGFGIDQPESQPRLPVRPAYGADHMVARRAGLPDHGSAGPRQGDRKLIGDAVRDFAVFRAGVDRAQRDRRPIAAWNRKRRHRPQRIGEHGLPFHGLRRRFAKAAAILDGKPAAMRESATLCDIHHPGIGNALQQFAARGLEPDITQSRAGRLAEKLPELPLQRAAGQARGLGEFGHAPVVPDIRSHRIERATDATRQQGRARSSDRACIHGRLSSDMTLNTGLREKFHDRDSSVANWIEDSCPLS